MRVVIAVRRGEAEAAGEEGTRPGLHQVRAPRAVAIASAAAHGSAVVHEYTRLSSAPLALKWYYKRVQRFTPAWKHAVHLLGLDDLLSCCLSRQRPPLAILVDLRVRSELTARWGVTSTTRTKPGAR